jgi:hypothetical protein
LQEEEWMEATVRILKIFSYNNVPFTKDGYLLAFDGTWAEIWRKELDTNMPGSMDNEIHSIIKDSGSSDEMGWYFAGTTPGTFGTFTFPLPPYQGRYLFVMTGSRRIGKMGEDC